MPDQYWLRCQELVYADQTDPSNMLQAGVKVFSMRVLVLTPLAAGSDPDFAHVGNAAELPKPWNLLLLGESSQEVPVKVSRIIQNSPDLQAFFYLILQQTISGTLEWMPCWSWDAWARSNVGSAVEPMTGNRGRSAEISDASENCVHSSVCIKEAAALCPHCFSPPALPSQVIFDFALCIALSQAFLVPWNNYRSRK